MLCSRILAALFVAVLVPLAGCSDPPATGTMTVQLTDAPFPFDMIVAAEFAVDGVEVHVTAADEAYSGFHVVSDAASVVNLLDLSNGLTAFVGEADLPVGEVKQMRLLVSSAAVELTDGRTFDLDVPSGESSGLKVFLDPPAEIMAGRVTEVLVDVDVSGSFSARPADPTQVDEITGFRFHPVLRVAVLSETGALSGRVTSSADGSPIADATVSLRHEGTTVTSTVTDASGDWMILGVTPGVWTVRAEAVGFALVETTAEVVAGESTSAVDLELD